MDRNNVLIICCILGIILIGFLARYNFRNINLINDFPIMFASGDANSRLSEAEYVLEAKDARYMPSWFTGEDDILSTQPPLNLIIVPMIAGGSLTNVFDMFYFTAIIASIGAALCFFVFFSYFFKNKFIGIITAVLLIYPIESFFHYAFNVGMYASFSVILFYPIILIFTYIFIKDSSFKNGFLLALSLGLQFLFHSSEAIISVLAIGSYLLFFELKNISFKKLFFVGLIFLILIFSYFLILYDNFYLGAGNKIVLSENKLVAPEHEPQIFLTSILNPIFYFLLIFGIITTWKKRDYLLINYVLLFHVFIIFILANLGLGTYYISIRMRLIFFIFTYPIVAIGIYNLAKYLSKIIKVQKNFLVIFSILLLFSYQVYSINESRSRQVGVYSEEFYKGLMWVKENFPKNSTVLCFGCYQFNGLPTHRVIAQPIYWEQKAVDQMISISNKSNTSLYLELSGFADERLVKKGLFKVEMRNAIGYTDRNICDFDYFIFTPYQGLTELFTRIANTFMNKNSTSVYSTNNFIVLKNAHKGENCV